MDGSRLDHLLRVLAETPSRRGAMRLLAGSALGGLQSRGIVPAEGRNKKKKKKVKICHQGRTLRVAKKKKKAHLRHGDTIGACQPGAQCQGRNVCVDGDAAACGAPGNDCFCWVDEAGASVCGGNAGALVADSCDDCAQAGRRCVRGGDTYCGGPFLCVLPCCPPGFRECGGKCVDVLRDSENCGNCGQDCGTDRPNICAGGSCCNDAGGSVPCRCAPSGSACAPVGAASCCDGPCVNGVCP